MIPFCLHVGILQSKLWSLISHYLIYMLKLLCMIVQITTYRIFIYVTLLMLKLLLFKLMQIVDMIAKFPILAALKVCGYPAEMHHP